MTHTTIIAALIAAVGLLALSACSNGTSRVTSMGMQAQEIIRPDELFSLLTRHQDEQLKPAGVLAAYGEPARAAGFEPGNEPDPLPSFDRLLIDPIGAWSGTEGVGRTMDRAGGTVNDSARVYSNVEPAVAGQAPDAEYQWFGWWLRKTPGGFLFNTIAGSTGGELSASFADLTGTAVYTGPAIGKAAVESGRRVQGSDFAATIVLDADFAARTVSGEVSNFTGGGMAGWRVTLPEVQISALGAFASTQGDSATLPVWTIDGVSRAPAGSFDGQFHGDDGTGAPDALVGTFEASFGATGHMAGAFGAGRQQGTGASD